MREALPVDAQEHMLEFHLNAMGMKLAPLAHRAPIRNYNDCNEMLC